MKPKHIHPWSTIKHKNVNLDSINILFHFCLFNKYTHAETIFIYKEFTDKFIRNIDVVHAFKKISKKCKINRNSTHQFNKRVKHLLNIPGTLHSKNANNPKANFEKILEFCIKEYDIKTPKKKFKNDIDYLNALHCTVIDIRRNQTTLKSPEEYSTIFKYLFLEATKRGLTNTEIKAYIHVSSKFEDPIQITDEEINNQRIKFVHMWKEAGYDLVSEEMSDSSIAAMSTMNSQTSHDIQKNGINPPINVTEPIKEISKPNLFKTSSKPERTSAQKNAASQRIQHLEETVTELKVKAISEVPKEVPNPTESTQENQAEVNVELLMYIESLDSQKIEEINKKIERFLHLANTSQIESLNKNNLNQLCKYIYHLFDTNKYKPTEVFKYFKEIYL